ncbi:OLC1v1038210C1 [Oldenlandia corymbosa var. corymbosa]|uniref:Ubiquitin carboxyl-terminal hydrolase n=1 Tax=Oldenlandia corymbosa var. corymbosa TaxID=529605 RepID=A0AAV1D086_OLDCO|nr:OLC1v1038210C1 [Oldenlandia corymbosa var. corymbosa]
MTSGFMLENQTIEFPTTPEEERRIIKELSRKADSEVREGSTYYVLSTKWYLNWKKYTEQPVGLWPSSSPGPIDNSDIIVSDQSSNAEDPQLRGTLLERRDYVLLSEEAWGRLYSWYEGGPVIARKMIAVGDSKQLVVEMFPLCLRLIDSRDDSECLVRLSKKASLGELYEVVCRLKGVDPGKARIVDYFNKWKQSVLVALNGRTLEDSDLIMNQHILLEVHNDDDRSWPYSFGTGSIGNTLSRILFGGDVKDEYDSIFRSVRKPIKRGTAGLQNLGNTCFMDSALQCLVHTPPISDYFLKDYTDEINQENPLGTNGNLALAFGELLRDLWSCEEPAVAPRMFKGILGRFAPQFSGYNQHDSQELLAFLLDGLHEDLNRIKQKPYIEAKDYDGRPDEEVADELWRYHKARNDSIIVDVFQGQYKSTLVCPICNKISYTFDPFMYLSLPLPSTATRDMTVTVFHGDGSGLPAPYTITVLKQGCCKDLIQALGTACDLRTDEYLLLAEVFLHKIHRYFEDPAEELATIVDSDRIVAYRLPKRASDLTRLEITHRLLQKSYAFYGPHGKDLTPLVTFLEDPESDSDIDVAVNRVLAPFRREGFSCAIDNGVLGIKSSPPFSLTNDRQIARDTVGRFVGISLDWNERDCELYDADSLKDLPEVQNTGPALKKPKQEEAISLFSCLDAFLEEEPLGPDDMWYCPNCKEHRQATKKLDLWRLPEVLVFHLKRFSYSRWLKNKLETLVDFPIRNLDLSDYVKGRDSGERSNVYELYAVSNHSGRLGGGHYTANCRLIEGRGWYEFNDHLVSSIKEKEIKTSEAYVLFYRRKTSNASKGTTQQHKGRRVKKDGRVKKRLKKYLGVKLGSLF